MRRCYRCRSHNIFISFKGTGASLPATRAAPHLSHLNPFGLNFLQWPAASQSGSDHPRTPNMHPFHPTDRYHRSKLVQKSHVATTFCVCSCAGKLSKIDRQEEDLWARVRDCGSGMAVILTLSKLSVRSAAARLGPHRHQRLHNCHQCCSRSGLCLSKTLFPRMAACESSGSCRPSAGPSR